MAKILKAIDNPRAKSTAVDNSDCGIVDSVETGGKKQTKAISMTQFHPPSKNDLAAGDKVGSTLRKLRDKQKGYVKIKDPIENDNDMAIFRPAYWSP